jgi:hypothetical protein
MHKSRENKIIKIVTRIPRSCKENFTNREKECSCVRTGGELLLLLLLLLLLGGWAMGEKGSELRNARSIRVWRHRQERFYAIFV